MDEWVRVERAAGTGASSGASHTGQPDRGQRSRRAAVGPATSAPVLPTDVATEIRRAARTATARHKEVLVSQMESAVAGYERGRYQDALRLGKQLASEVGSVAAVRRVAGFAAYRLGRWRDAIRHLEAYTDLADEIDAIPALMDCERALGRHGKVGELWAELRHRSPDADVLAEARIVAAGSLADRGELAQAIELLAMAGAGRSLRNPSERHLRQWYALGDLYERAGDVPRARELFVRVARADPEAYDVAERLDALGPDRRRARRRRPSGGSPGRAPAATSPAGP